MKRALHLVSIIFLVTACGGGGDPKEKPPVPATAEGKKQMEELHRLALSAQQTCCSSAAPFMIAVGTALMSPNPALNAPSALPAMDSCKTAILNFEMLFRSLDNGQYANRADAQQWRKSQGIGVINCVGDQMQAAGLPVNPGNIPMYFMAAKSLTDRLQGAVAGLPPFPQQPPDGRSFLNPRSSLGGPSLGLGYGGGYSGYGSSTNPYAQTGSGLGNNPFGTGQGFTSPGLGGPFGAPNFNSPNAGQQVLTSNGQVFNYFPSIPPGFGL